MKKKPGKQSSNKRKPGSKNPFPPKGKRSSKRRPRPSGKPTKINARWLAFLALKAYRSRGVFVSKVLDDLFREHRPLPIDRRMATELANETVRRSLTIDTILNEFVTREQSEVEPDLWTILQLGCLQLVCLRHIPTHAAVNETVELCAKIGVVQAKPFINGVIRNIERSVVETSEKSFEVPSIESLNARTLPLAKISGTQMSVSRLEFNRDLFADPKSSLIEYISQSTSQPEWSLQRRKSQGSSDEDLLRTGLWMTTPGHFAVRVNTTQTYRDQVLEVLKTAKLDARPGQLPEAIEVDGSFNVADLPGFRDGWYSVQDLSAMAATDLLDPQPGERILDLCAAPGGKTTHIAERLNGTGSVLACDTSKRRIKAVKDNASRLKLMNIETQIISDDGSDFPDGPFDAALVDVPCSNTGVLGKRPEARWRLSPESFDELVEIQKSLLNRAIDLTKPGGRVVYSTCSIDTAENRGVLDSILAERDDVEISTETHHTPGNPADGGYQTLLIRQ